MTDSPINLDEAHRSIESGRHKQIRSVETGKWEVLIEGDYLESIVSELEAGRKRIADLEGFDRHHNQREAALFAEKNELEHQLKIDRATIDAYRSQNIDYSGRLAKTIIPQAEDASCIRELLKKYEYSIQVRHMLKRYLAAIEGGKP